MKRIAKILAPVALALIAGSNAAVAAPALPDRGSDPVILSGGQTPKFNRYLPKRIVAFRWRDSWKQVPVQVDERKVVDYLAVRGHAGDFKPFSNLAYATMGSLLRTWLTRGQRLIWFNRIMATVLVVTAAWMATI